MDYKSLLLNRLLDKFERSKAYLSTDVKRRILLTFGTDDYPEYDIEDSPKRELINAIVIDLSQKGLLQYEWLKHERGNIIAKVWLQMDNVRDAYRECGRVPKSDKASDVFDLVQKMKHKVVSPWIIHFIEDTIDRIENKKSPLPYLPEDVPQAKAILLALEAIDRMGKGTENEESLERVFSLKCYGDSKYFERHVKRKIIEVIKKYLLAELYEENGLAEVVDEDILAQVGIVKAPELMEFSGGLLGNIAGRPVDFSIFRQGIALNSHTVADLEITGYISEIERVLFIENKANYIDYIFHKAQNNELVVFHGGFYSPAKGRFFQKLYEPGRRKGLEFYHWGDIDLGGFRIFQRLRTKIIPELQPYLMDQEALIARKEYWSTMEKTYKTELEKLLTQDDFTVFYEVISLMLKHDCKLEQEAFLI